VSIAAAASNVLRVGPSSHPYWKLKGKPQALKIANCRTDNFFKNCCGAATHGAEAELRIAMLTAKLKLLDGPPHTL
jgi:hypothetical protein